MNNEIYVLTSRYIGEKNRRCCIQCPAFVKQLALVVLFLGSVTIAYQEINGVQFENSSAPLKYETNVPL